MYLNGFQCDNCEKIHNVDMTQWHKVGAQHDLPESWLHVDEQNKPARHFCSASCLYQWATNTVNQHEKQWKY